MKTEQNRIAIDNSFDQIFFITIAIIRLFENHQTIENTNWKLLEYRTKLESTENSSEQITSVLTIGIRLIETRRTIEVPNWKLLALCIRSSNEERSKENSSVQIKLILIVEIWLIETYGMIEVTNWKLLALCIRIFEGNSHKLRLEKSMASDQFS
ncbi:Hypothetical predicted protein [Olea europaea subsp. europaea]|uniref:Uncharacterized protein n=1 Tax=Olea europaea subsp. europaea TaxID=158383 RepID=A0A8S0SCZ0_OLEEU|nr:Hypothetical predicted protein [Olea europaea subsp. europaea]